MPMKGLILLSFYQKKRRTEQVRKNDAMKYRSSYQKIKKHEPAY
jgi:hypothetical protein